MTTAVILAGGLGTRLRSAVANLPKPMAPVRGRPFLEFLMDYWIDQGVRRFILSVGYCKDAITDHFGERYRGVSIGYAVETEPLGTGGGLLRAASGLVEPFLLLNGDTFFEVDLRQLRELHSGRNSAWTFSLFRTTEPGRYMGLELEADGRIRSLSSPETRLERLANGGVYFVDPMVLEKVPFAAGRRVSLEDDILPAIVAAGGLLYGLESSGTFIDIGVPEDYFRSETVLLGRR